MDAIQLLKNDHKEVESLFKELEGLSPTAKASRKKIFEQIDQALTVHAKIEETIFYPAVKKRANRDKEAKEEVLEAYEEHSNVKAMIKKLEETDPADETYEAKLEVLHELVKHHVKEEEHALFPEAKSLLDKEELQALGEELEEAKSGAMESGNGKARRSRSTRGTTDAEAESEVAH